MSQEFISREVISIQEIEDDFFATCSLVSAKWEHMDPNLKSDGIIKLYESWVDQQNKLQKELEENPDHRSLSELQAMVKLFNQESEKFLLLIMPEQGMKGRVN